MANNQTFKIKNGLHAKTYKQTVGETSSISLGTGDEVSTVPYTGTSSSYTIENGLDLSTDGGLVILKRTDAAGDWNWFDTERTDTTYNTPKRLSSNNTNAEDTYFTSGEFSFLTNGFNLNTSDTNTNSSGVEYASWSFKQEPGVFDIVNYSGTGGYQGSIPHNLGVNPGMIIVKRRDSGSRWAVWHTSISPNNIELSSNAGSIGEYAIQDVTSTKFGVANYSTLSASQSGGSYVAYLFANDTSPNGKVRCGSYTGSSSQVTVNLGWKPATLLIKKYTNSADWQLFDLARGGMAGTGNKILAPNIFNDEEYKGYDHVEATSTGFTIQPNNAYTSGSSSESFIYLAIRDSSNVHELDLSKGNQFSILNNSGASAEIVFNNPPATGKAFTFSVEINNDGSALSWPSSIKWDGASTPDTSATKELYTFITTDGGTTYYGKKAGENIS